MLINQEDCSNCDGTGSIDGVAQQMCADNPYGTIQCPFCEIKNMTRIADKLTPFIGTKLVNAVPMTLGDYNILQGWDLPEGQDPDALGYLVEYTDGGKPNHEYFGGYISWSPAEVFDGSYQASGNLSFGHAIELAKLGMKVARAGWNGKGMWVIFNAGSAGETHAMFEGSVYKKHGVDKCEILPHFDMYTVNAEGRRAMLPGWLASQSDMIANDWCVVA